MQCSNYKQYRHKQKQPILQLQTTQTKNKNNNIQIYFDENEALGELGEIEESGEVTKDGYDEMFDMDIKKFGHAATFSQVVNTTATTTITGYLEFMTCDSMQCLFPDPIEFTIDAN